MNLIPVIDLMRGEVVRAVRGERHLYRPIVSALCDGSEPATVARALCLQAAARCLYVADLDALQGGVLQRRALRDMLIAVPGVELWLDAGFTDSNHAADLCRTLGVHAHRVVPVFGSESLRDADALRGCFGAQGRHRDAVLSLDRRDGAPLDRAGCWDTPALWPARVIVMTLERVGSGCGPDLATLADVQRRAPHVALYGAGGVRDRTDLEAAAASGAQGWLVASALHDRRLAPLDEATA